LYAALNLDKKFKALLLSKKNLTVSNSALAQGGIAIESDNLESHINDTLKAGGYENNRENLQIMVENAVKIYEELMQLGVNFDHGLGLEGGHSRNRIVHCKDSTGYEIVTALTKKVKSLPNIDFLENAHLLRLEKKYGDFLAEVERGSLDAPKARNAVCRGRHALHYYTANTVLIATGGIGRVYDYTTNSAISTGDGIQFAYSLGAKIEKMNLIQFHPTAFAAGLDAPGSSPHKAAFLITEAARGEGAYIYNKNMKRFTDELAPRDVVSRSMIEESKRTESKDFYLDISHRDPGFVKSRFPMICQNLLESGYDFTKEPVPIYPCQHYLMGGITVDFTGKTTVEGLYAIGECSFTGVHGNNRLASNSLLEALVFSRLAAEDINEKTHHDCVPPLQGEEFDAFKGSCTKPIPKNLCYKIRRIMQKSFFVIPDYEEARKGLVRVTEIRQLLESGEFAITPEFVEAKSLATAAYLILKEVTENALT
jgi:L-aspartate oxidase